MRAAPPPKLAPGTTLRKLPWLDGKMPQVHSGTTSQTSSLSATRSCSEQQPSLTVPRLIATGGAMSDAGTRRSANTPTGQKKLVSSIVKRRMLAAESPLESSLSSGTVTERDTITAMAAPIVVSRLQTTPSCPRPGRSAFERLGNSRISNAVDCLEDMVQEAVDIADHALHDGQVEEIYEIIEGARQAINQAVVDPRQLMITSSPLSASESSHVSEGSGRYPRISSHPEPISSPTLLVQRDTNQDSEDQVLQQVQVDLEQAPTTVDWAYPPRDSPASATSSSERSTTHGGRSGICTRSDLLLPPDPSRPATRDHVDLVLRPIRDHSRGRPYKRTTRDRMMRKRQPHRHHRLQSHCSPDRRDTSSSASRHRRQCSSEPSISGEAFDEEDYLPRPYGGTLHVRNQVQRHTFSLRRQHRRQPIARDWGNGRKRWTAVTACVNTALLGIIIGVYVSAPQTDRKHSL